jgi:hypothetical protein
MLDKIVDWVNKLNQTDDVIVRGRIRWMLRKRYCLEISNNGRHYIVSI